MPRTKAPPFSAATGARLRPRTTLVRGRPAAKYASPVRTGTRRAAARSPTRSTAMPTEPARRGRPRATVEVRTTRARAKAAGSPARYARLATRRATSRRRKRRAEETQAARPARGPDWRCRVSYPRHMKRRCASLLSQPTKQLPFPADGSHRGHLVPSLPARRNLLAEVRRQLHFVSLAQRTTRRPASRLHPHLSFGLRAPPENT
jgi:hypothetical protein